MNKEQKAGGVLAWAFRDSTTGKASSTKIISVLFALLVVALCLIWAIQGDLTFDKAQDFLWKMFATERAGNIGIRGVKAYQSSGADSSDASA